MFWGIEASTMAFIENLTMEKNKRKEEHECEIERELIYQTRIFNLK
jgi:hypothetical protein